MTAERIFYASVDSQTYGEVLKHLSEGWKMDPFFHTSGRPWSIEKGHLWVLVKGSPEEVAELNPFIELPPPEVTEADQRTIDKFEGIIDVVDFKPEDIVDGRVTDLTSDGWEVFNILKGSIVLVKKENQNKAPPFVRTEEAVGPLEVRNGVMMNCITCGKLFMVPHEVDVDEFICPLCRQLPEEVEA